MRVGFLGGTFDPIHLGHLRAAEEIGEGLDLQKIHLVPVGIPPHKTPDPLAGFSHRMEMVRLACAISPLLEAWDIEGKRPGLSYSIETLRLFHSMFGPQLELFFIVGIDAFLEIKTWKKYRELFKCASFVVINRAGYDTQEFAGFLDSLNVGFAWDPEGRCFCHPSGNILLQKETTVMDISASRIRQMVAERKSIRFLVPEVVREYIERCGLYLVNESTR